ncbi:MAG: M15 family metallopeptidase [Flavobacteriales bacterium]|nr:M15 family metallopeptidase [Flavobacteriales bacterium]
MSIRTFIALLVTLLFSKESFSQMGEKLVNIETLSSKFLLDIRYATTNNFLKEELYECEACYLLQEVAEAINNANYYFCDRGYIIQFYDCYRPLSVQKRMWAKVPNPIYIADPARGSAHNRGIAVDLTLVKKDGSYIDMGTDYDFFGRKAHTDNFNLPKEILANRKLLQDGLKAFGFATIQSEWWHFSYPKKNSAPLMDAPLSCK